jgi:hypothetical protein
MNYRLAYAIGFHPWEDLAEHPPFAGKLLRLVAREEEGNEPPHGIHHAGAEIVESSPTDVLGETMGVVMENVRAAGVDA